MKFKEHIAITVYLIPILLFVFSFILRFSLISKGPYNMDCLTLALTAEKTLETKTLHFYNGPGHPLTVILGAFFIYLARKFAIYDPVIAVNFMSVVFGSACIPLLYLIGKKIFDQWTAVFSAIMLSITPIFLSISTYGKEHAPNIFFLFLGVNSLINYHRENKKWSLFLSAIYFALMGAARIYELVLLIIPISLLFLFGYHSVQSDKRIQNTSKRIKSLIIYLSMIGFVCLLFYLPFFFGKNSNTYMLGVGQFISSHFDIFLGLFSGRLLIAIGFLGQTFTWIGFIIAMLGFILIFKKNKNIFIFLILWVLIPLLFYGNGRNTVTSRYFVTILPPLCLTLGYFFSTFINKIKWTKYISYLSFLMIIFALFNTHYPRLRFRHTFSLAQDFPRWVAHNTEPNAQIISADERIFLEYYGKRKSFSRPLSFRPLNEEPLNSFKNSLDNALEDGIPIYIHAASLYAYNKKQIFSNFIRKNYNLTFIGEHLYEDWHRGEMADSVFICPLFKITKKPIALKGSAIDP